MLIPSWIFAIACFFQQKLEVQSKPEKKPIHLQGRTPKNSFDVHFVCDTDQGSKEGTKCLGWVPCRQLIGDPFHELEKVLLLRKLFQKRCKRSPEPSVHRCCSVEIWPRPSNFLFSFHRKTVCPPPPPPSPQNNHSDRIHHWKYCISDLLFVHRHYYQEADQTKIDLWKRAGTDILEMPLKSCKKFDVVLCFNIHLGELNLLKLETRVVLPLQHQYWCCHLLTTRKPLPAQGLEWFSLFPGDSAAQISYSAQHFAPARIRFLQIRDEIER